jgi:tyrosyl-DNA phosphodiesterase-1
MHGWHARCQSSTAQQVAYVQDLPLNASTGTSRLDHQVPCTFARVFEKRIRIKGALNHLADKHVNGGVIPLLGTKDLVSSYDSWDWSKVKFQIVFSTFGRHFGEAEVERFGMTGLAHILRTQGWMPGPGERLCVEYQVKPSCAAKRDSVQHGLSSVHDQNSSLSQWAVGWMSDFWKCLRGLSPGTILSQTRPKAVKNKPSEWPPIKVVFPTLATVDNSILGRQVSVRHHSCRIIQC